jgi:hypothetical protein
LFGDVTFSNRFTSQNRAGAVDGHPYADFLLGIPSTARRAFAPFRLDRNRWQIAGFVTDDFKVSSKLTLNLGLRYQQHRPWRENQNRISLFDVTTGSIVVPDGSLSKVSPLFPRAPVPPNRICGQNELRASHRCGLPALEPKHRIPSRVGHVLRRISLGAAGGWRALPAERVALHESSQ